MNEYFNSILETSNIPILSALILGLMTAISPCPLATNITATAFISKNISDKKTVLLSGIIYSLGRAFSYTIIGLILFLGANKFHIARFFNQNGEKFLGPLLIIIALIMLNVIKLNFGWKSNLTQRFADKFAKKGHLGAFLIGVIFALAFCPYSGALYFGILIPMVITNVEGLFLPFVFAIGTGVPVILFSFLLAFATQSVGIFYDKITNFEQIMRKVSGVVFLLVGIYYIAIFSGLIK
ncbi:MAG: sulfite exporter TauE/SafE family protein [Calditrichaeota bacterium]|nr:MAG: sulfite exporter TauE/SafE family protein [Calditrichota bacterium]